MDTLEAANLIEIELAKALEIPLDSLHPDAQMSAFDLWDSLTMVQFAAAISEHFGCSLGDDDISACNTVREIVALVQERVASK
jgi:acyl carrier protein